MLGGLLGWLAGSVLRVRRAHVEGAMTRAGIARPELVATAMYRRLGRALVDWVFGRMDRVAPDLTALDTPGPVVIFATHTGNWELAAAVAARSLRGERRLFVVAKAMSDRVAHAIVSRLRARDGVHTIAPRGAMRAALARLSTGDVVALPIDQVPDHAAHAITTTFLGSAALVDRAPATIAFRARATVLVVADGRVIDRIPPPATNDRAWIAATALRATAALEAFIRAEPERWMWLHRRWKGCPPCRPPAGGVVGDACRIRSSSRGDLSRAA